MMKDLNPLCLTPETSLAHTSRLFAGKFSRINMLELERPLHANRRWTFFWGGLRVAEPTLPFGRNEFLVPLHLEIRALHL